MTSTSTAIDLPALTEFTTDFDAATGELTVSISGAVAAAHPALAVLGAEHVAAMAEDLDDLVVKHMRAMTEDLQRLLSDEASHQGLDDD